jgi:hypothetical protein
MSPSMAIIGLRKKEERKRKRKRGGGGSEGEVGKQ